MIPSSSRLRSILFLLAAMLCFGPFAVAQDGAETVPVEEEVILDTVQVTGVQDDAAMAAFRAGDYQTAETEFLNNARCALRRERNVVASFDSARIEFFRAETLANSGTVDSGANTRGQTAGAGQTGISPGASVAARNIQAELDRSCDNRGRQMYFAGLSQIQLGKTDEALRSFEKATAESTILYDAHYKIGLIKLLSGDSQSAESELHKIERILDRCRNCEAKGEIIARRDHLRKAINGEVSLR